MLYQVLYLWRGVQQSLPKTFTVRTEAIRHAHHLKAFRFRAWVETVF